MFMLELVPEPVWKTSMGKASWCSPPMISSAPRGDRVGLLLADDAELGVDPRGGLLHPGDGDDVGRLEGGAADREVLHRALGLGAPEGVLGHLDLAHAVVLGAGLAVVAAHACDRTQDRGGRDHPVLRGRQGSTTRTGLPAAQATMSSSTSSKNSW